MRYKLLFLFFTIYSYTVNAQLKYTEKDAINNLINSWHQAASEANFTTYFEYFTNNAVFIGTDATENWSKKDFEAYAKPHFDKGKAWNFKSLERNIYISADQKTAWFDELLDTQMKICRGSGVLIKVKNRWKIAHYVLSISIPNELSNEVIQLKKSSDDVLIEKIKRQ